MVDATTDAPPAETPPAEPVVPAAEQDPFSLDEAKFASLTPEQRAALDPVLTEWKTKAKTELEKSGKTYQEKYKPVEEKAQALDSLVKDPRFVSWWNNLQQGIAAAVPGAQESAQGMQPKDIATPEEWQQAVSEAYQGNGLKMREIQARMINAMAAPVVQQLRQGQEELRTTLEMKDLFERHADAKTLDLVGRNAKDPTDKSLSLLEMALNWASDNGKSLEDGYQLARKWADSMKVGAQQEALGMVQEKKASVTSGPSTTQGGQGVVEVADADELMSKNMEYVLSGQKPPRFVIRPSKDVPSTRWAQRT